MKPVFLDALSKYDPLRLAVYTPSTIPLSERKTLGEILFSSLTGNEIPKIPKWFSPLFVQLTNNSTFMELQDLCRNNPVLSAQIAAEIIQGLDSTVEELLKSLKKWLKEEEDLEKPKLPRKRNPSIPFPSSVTSKPGMSASQEQATAISSTSQSQDSDVTSGDVSSDELVKGISSDVDNNEETKLKIEEILKGLSLLPIELSLQDYSKLPNEKKKESQSLVDQSLEDSLEEVLAKAKDWASLYDLLVAILPGLGWDYTPGSLKYNLLSKYLELSKLLEKIPQLKELANRLGRYHSLMGEKIWDPTAHGKSEVFSVERSGDIERILPGELVQLGYPTTKYLFYSKLADKSLLTYELKGEGWTQPEKQERGPVVICIDTSGSMSGSPESIAKAVSLAVTKEANSQSRSVHLILFGSRNETKDFTFNKSENAVQSLLSFLNLSFGGGTSFDTALDAALKMLKEDEFRLADVLFVTDGYGEISTAKDKIRLIKEEQGTRIFTLLIESQDFDATQEISDETWILNLQSGVSPSISYLRGKLRE